MITIQTRVTVDERGEALMKFPSGVAPGDHDVVVVIDAIQSAPKIPIMPGFPRHDVQVDLPPGHTFRREVLYDDSGRGA
jgi:hypothetical protein